MIVSARLLQVPLPMQGGEPCTPLYFGRRLHMSLDKATVAHIAKLARIAVPEQDLPALANELSGILK